ncbi:hypothetical protein NC651_002473 [Populus alba x Populus x berolinensis]|nr:hypothetical protein NC651_002473 [Populus alba x Populus x berolinensis]
MDEKWKLSKKEGSSSFIRSFSTKSSSSKAPLLRTSSLKSSSPKCPLPRSFSQKNSSISHKCSSLAKEQKARFYIMRRCVAMLFPFSSLFCLLMEERFLLDGGTGSKESGFFPSISPLFSTKHLILSFKH